jgi:anhydro-N-acetylmuramic acid kinase
MSKYKVIGLMSGTSLDGLDIAYCEFKKKDKSWSYKIVEAKTINYSETKKQSFINLMTSSGEELILAHNDYGFFLGKEVKKFISSKKLKPSLIASHGHTLFHQPERKFTLQIGNGAAIYAETKIPVVSDFRSVDVALGGQGAPLVPIGDELLFGDYDFCLNLGGISNISFQQKGKRIAFDISPVNIILNDLARVKGFPFDRNGKMARSGNLNEELLSKLNSVQYYKIPSPKSLGKEWIDKTIFPIIQSTSSSVEDKLRTCTDHIAYQIAETVKGNLKKKNGSLLVTGGGAFNTYLIDKLSEYLKGKCNVIVPDKNTVMFKEALIFAFLGVLRMRNEVNCLKTVTGAEMNNIGGAVYGPINAFS